MSVRENVISGLIAALEAVKESSSYPLRLSEVSEYDDNYLLTVKDRVPLLMVADTNQEELVARKDTDYKYALRIDFVGYVLADTKPELRGDLNNMNSFIKQFISETAGSTINSACQAIEYLASETHWVHSIEELRQGHLKGAVVINAVLRYKVIGGAF